MPPIILPRTRFFIAAEGDCEQSFVKWLKELSDSNGLHVHLECCPVGGGGYRTMLKKAVLYRQKRLDRGDYVASFLLVDKDRADQGEDISIEDLKHEAEGKNIVICCQKPNFEGLLVRMLPGKERVAPIPSSVETQLSSAWPAYKKSINARHLAQRYSLADLMRVASYDSDLQALLRTIGLSLDSI